MEITGKDFKDTDRVAGIINFVESADIAYFDRESNVLHQKQPFFISLFLGYKFDLNKEELGEVIKVIFIIWEYFKDNEKVRTTKVTKEQYERITLRNAYMLNYMIGEPSEKEKSEIVGSDLGHLQSKALLTGIIFKFKTNKILASIMNGKGGIILIGMKTLIECMEEIVYSSGISRNPYDSK
jgi:hypothetical protein